MCTTHAVVSGDTLWAIAAQFLGDGNRWPEIYDANQAVIEAATREHPGPPVFGTSDHGHWIFPGTSLTIPDATCAPAPQPPGPSSLEGQKCGRRGLVGILFNTPCPPISRRVGGLVPEGQKKEVALKCAEDLIGGKVIGTTMHYALRYAPASKSAEVVFNTFVAWMERTRADGVTVRWQTIIELLPVPGISCFSWVIPKKFTFNIPGLPTPSEVFGLPE